MNGTRPVPTNLDSWPGATGLDNDHKLILHVLWSSPPHVVDLIGVGRPGVIEHLCSAVRFVEPAVIDALKRLEKSHLIMLDEVTREVAVRRWCRFHTFNGVWGAKAKEAYERIASQKIKAVLMKEEHVSDIFPKEKPKNQNKSNHQTPNTTPKSNTKLTSPPQPTPNVGGAATEPSADGSVCGGGDEFLREIEQTIKDEFQGRVEAAQRGEAKVILSPEAWCEALRKRALAGENVRTEFGDRIAERRSADEALRQLEAYLDKTVQVEGIQNSVRITKVQSGFYGELVEGNGGIPHCELIKLSKRGAIRVC